MFYEERYTVDGWEYRTTPTGDWTPGRLHAESTRALSDLLPAIARHLFALNSDNWMLAQEVERAVARLAPIAPDARGVEADYRDGYARGFEEGRGVDYREAAERARSVDGLTGEDEQAVCQCEVDSRHGYEFKKWAVDRVCAIARRLAGAKVQDSQGETK